MRLSIIFFDISYQDGIHVFWYETKNVLSGFISDSFFKKRGGFNRAITFFSLAI